MPRPPSEGMKASSPRGLFLMVQIFQLQDSLKAFLMVSFGRNASIYLICQDFTRPSNNTENFSHCLKCLEYFMIHIFYLYSKKVKMPYLGLFCDSVIFSKMCKMCERLFTGRKQAIVEAPLVTRAVLLPGFPAVNASRETPCLPLSLTLLCTYLIFLFLILF